MTGMPTIDRGLRRARTVDQVHGALALSGFGARGVRGGPALPAAERLADRGLHRRRVEASDHVEAGARGAEVARRRSRGPARPCSPGASSRWGRGGRTDGPRRGRRGTSPAPAAGAGSSAIESWRARSAFRRPSSVSGNFGLRATSATSATISGPNSERTSPPMSVRFAPTATSSAPPMRAASSAICVARLRVVVPSREHVAGQVREPDLVGLLVDVAASAPPGSR